MGDSEPSLKGNSMSEDYRSYLVSKYFEPEGAYKESLVELSRPDSFENLGENLDLVMERRDLTPQEAQEVTGRQHIKYVVEEGTRGIPEPIVEQAVQAAVTAEQARAFHRVPDVLVAGYKGQNVKVAVLDTGLTQGAADKLGSRVIAHESMVPGEDWVDTNQSRSHGTWCAGTIADIAPECQLIIIKVLSSSSGSGSDSGIIRGINRAVGLGAQVISESLGGGVAPQLDEAVSAARAKGVLMPCAAGNEQQGRADYSADNSSPARSSGAQTTGAVDVNGNIANFSSWGNCVDEAAIGVQISSSWQQGAWSGTSMATPHIAGIDALLLSVGKGPDSTEVALYAGARDTALETYKEGHGIADALASLQRLKGQQPLRNWQQRGWFDSYGNYHTEKSGNDPSTVWIEIMDDQGMLRFRKG
jgi:subtilisin family serine protease